MDITLKIPDEIGEKLQNLPNPDEFTSKLLEKAFEDEAIQNVRPLTDLEEQFLQKSIASADRGKFVPDEEMREFFKNNGVETDEY